MKGYIQKIATTLIDRVVDRISQRMNDGRLADDIAYRTLAETSLVGEMADKRPNDLFSGISDGFWFWLCTEGYRRIPELRKVLPSMPPEDVQLMFTGDKGDPVLREGFSAYVLFRDLYQSHVGPLANSAGIMDFGCGWGRIIRFFLKDIDPTRLYGVDPVDEMVSLCKERDRWCTFERISPEPPMRFQDNAFDLIYSFSVFSHLSEEMHKRWLVELRRVLKPGGLFIATTRGREFIEYCGQMRRRKDLAVMHPGPGSSASAFLNTEKSLSDFDEGSYCFSQLVHDKWSYWGETAIPKRYVANYWSRFFNSRLYRRPQSMQSERDRSVQGILTVSLALLGAGGLFVFSNTQLTDALSLNARFDTHVSLRLKHTPHFPALMLRGAAQRI